MLRDRAGRPRWLVYSIVAWGVFVLSVPAVEAAPLPPATVGTAAPDLEGVRAALEQRLVRERLAALGVSSGEAAAVLDRLSPEERAELATRAHELAVAGDSGIAFLAFAIIVGLLVILVLELLGHRIISQP